MSPQMHGQKRMNGAIPALCMLWVVVACALGDSLVVQKPEISKNVLIANSGSYLENMVSRFVRDSLSTKGYTVKRVRLESLKDEQAGSYCATIIMNAVKSSKLQGVVRWYSRALGTNQSNILICTVYGEDYKNGKTLSDAVSTATTTIDPAGVASKIINGFNAIIGAK